MSSCLPTNEVIGAMPGPIHPCVEDTEKCFLEMCLELIDDNEFISKDDLEMSNAVESYKPSDSKYYTIPIPMKDIINAYVENKESGNFIHIFQDVIFNHKPMFKHLDKKFVAFILDYTDMDEKPSRDLINKLWAGIPTELDSRTLLHSEEEVKRNTETTDVELSAIITSRKLRNYVCETLLKIESTWQFLKACIEDCEELQKFIGKSKRSKAVPLVLLYKLKANFTTYENMQQQENFESNKPAPLVKGASSDISRKAAQSDESFHTCNSRAFDLKSKDVSR